MILEKDLKFFILMVNGILVLLLEGLEMMEMVSLQKLLSFNTKSTILFLFLGAFAKNPQFFINLNDPDPYDDVTQCPVVISLMQRQKKRKCEHAIGFKIFKCEQTAKNLDEQYFRYHSSVNEKTLQIV